jgi:hypothetical protein
LYSTLRRVRRSQLWPPNRTAITPDFALAHCNLGFVLQDKGLFSEALEEFERGHKLGLKQTGWSNPSAQWIRTCRRMLELEARLPALLKNESRIKDDDERLTIADLCYKKSLPAASARFYGETFADRPRIGEDLATGHRYNAACAAAMAGCGAGKDNPPPDSAVRTALRRQALDWLKADLAAWVKIVENGQPEARGHVVQTLRHWQQDSDLAGLRNETAMAQLPESERETLRQFWAEVRALVTKAMIQPRT